jgi:hypothetical protein
MCMMNAAAPVRPFLATRGHFLLLLAALAGCLAGNSAALADPGAELFWPQWRGPLSTGEAPHEGRQQNNTFASASPVTDGKRLLAIRLGRQGDLTGTDAIVWSHGKNTPYVPSPLLADSQRLFA